MSRLRVHTSTNHFCDVSLSRWAHDEFPPEKLTSTPCKQTTGPPITNGSYMSDRHQPEVKFLAESCLWIEVEKLCNPNSVKQPHFQLTDVAKMRVRVTLRVRVGVRVTPTPTLILAVTLALTLGVTLVLATPPVNTSFQNPLGQNVRPLVLKKKILIYLS